MLNYHHLMIGRELHREQLRRAELQRMQRQHRTDRRRQTILMRILVQMGAHLEAWGRSLQARHGTPATPLERTLQQ